MSAYALLRHLLSASDHYSYFTNKEIEAKEDFLLAGQLVSGRAVIAPMSSLLTTTLPRSRPCLLLT